MKKLLALLLAMTMALALVACGGNGGNNTANNTGNNTTNNTTNDTADDTTDDTGDTTAVTNPDDIPDSMTSEDGKYQVAFITDVGSTKLSIHEQVKELQMEDVFVGGHPMAGSEKTGYENATDHLLENAYYIITPTARSRKEDVERLTAVAGAIRAIPVVLDYREHDSIVAAVSHLPHLVASSLVNLVRENDTPGERMKQLAAGGFKDITRIASASPVMWEQICMTNRGPIADILEKYIASLQEVLEQVKSSDSDAIFRLFDESKTYRNSFADSGKGSVMPDYSFSVDILDEPGAISTISVILAAKGISIKNIGINHNRELGEGALRITFYQEKEMRAAWMYLQRHNYTLIKG